MIKIEAKKAVGTVLAHDITRIIPGKFKGVAFKKGHIIKEKDIPELLKMGKRHLFVSNLKEGQVHEDEAALRIAAAISGDNLEYTEPKEGKTSILCTCDGLLKVNVKGLLEINKLDNVIIATRKSDYSCNAKNIIAATRIIPLVIEEKNIIELERLANCHNPLLKLSPFRKLRVGGIVTGYEIFNGLVKDEFDKYVGKKIVNHGCEFVKKMIVPDDVTAISEAILELKHLGCQLILTTGGLSVDPDDVTKKGVEHSGANCIFYGSPILPGAMFLYALLDNVTVLGLPACVYYHQTTVFDIILPKVLAGESINKEDIAALGHGGLCMNCIVCHYPACPFGK